MPQWCGIYFIENIRYRTLGKYSSTRNGTRRVFKYQNYLDSTALVLAVQRTSWQHKCNIEIPISCQPCGLYITEL